MKPDEPVLVSIPDGYLVFSQRECKEDTKLNEAIQLLCEVAASVDGEWRDKSKTPFGFYIHIMNRHGAGSCNPNQGE